MMGKIVSSCGSRKQANDELGVGDTWLKVKTINGNPFLVDQDGKLVNGIRSVSVSSDVKDITIGSCTFISRSEDV